MKRISPTYNNAMTDFLINPQNRIYRHLLLILCMAVVAVNAALLSFPYDYNIAFAYSIGLLGMYLGITYLNLRVLVPHYLLRNRYLIYLIVLTALVLLSIAVDLTMEFNIKKHFHLAFGKFSFLENPNVLLLNIIATCFLYVICFGGMSIGVLFQHWLISGRQVNELEKATTQKELQHLKSQIQPDFLFSTLEKAGKHAILNSEKTSGILIKLSRFLRYQLYDSARNEVMLSSEVASLETLLNLVKEQRSGFTYSIKIDGDTKQVLIPPLLFISLVLHTINKIKEAETNPFVNLSFCIRENFLEFTCSGTKSGELNDFKNALNIQRRLELLFGENYTLDFKENGVSHTIYLCLNL